jgi:lipid-binding SYLF domain-containing protein
MNKFMKKMAALLMTALVLCLMTTAVFAADTDKSEKEQAKIVKERAEIDELSAKALANLYEKVPSAERVIDNCYAYATLSNTGMKLGIFGDAHGRGLAVNNETGERLYMRMKEMGIGLGLGVKEYDLIFVIGTEAAWNSFISGDIKFASSAEASANDGVTGDSIEGASIAAKGVWVYQITKKGLTLDASIKGTKIYPDKKLNIYEEEENS